MYLIQCFVFRKTKSIKETSSSFTHSETQELHDNNDGGRDAGAIEGVCFFMVFGALIEYACVGYTAKRIQLRKNRSLLAPSTIPLPARATFSQTNKTTLKYIWLLHFSLRSNMKGIQLHVVIRYVLFQILGHAEAGRGEEG